MPYRYNFFTSSKFKLTKEGSKCTLCVCVFVEFSTPPPSLHWRFSAYIIVCPYYICASMIINIIYMLRCLHICINWNAYQIRCAVHILHYTHTNVSGENKDFRFYNSILLLVRLFAYQFWTDQKWPFNCIFLTFSENVTEF